MSLNLIFEKISEPEIEQVEPSKELLHSVVTQLEARFWLTGEYPDPQVLNNICGTNFSDLKLMNSDINKALSKRELPPFDPFKPRKEIHELDPSFVIAVNSLVDISDKRSKTIKLKAVGLTTQKFNILLKNPVNKTYYERRAEEAFDNVTPVAKTSLGKLVDSGDLQAIKYYFEFQGIHDPNKTVNDNLNKLISLFMEVLVTHVPKEVIDVISKEFNLKLLELN